MSSKRVSRTDLRVTVAWLRAHRTRAVLVVLLLVIAGVLSVLGALRWQQAGFRWAFAVMSWLAAVLVVRVLMTAVEDRSGD